MHRLNHFSIVIFCLCCSIPIKGQSPLDSVEWVKGFQDRGLSPFLLATDAENNIILAGVYEGCDNCFIQYQGDTIVSKGNGTDELFIAKLDSTGALVHYQVIGGIGDDDLVGLAVDLNNHILLYTQNEEDLVISNTTVRKGFNILKFNPDFDLIWVTNITGAAHSVISGSSVISSNYTQFAVNNQNEILLYGSIHFNLDHYDTLIIDGHPFHTEISNIFLSKLDHNGKLKWVKLLEHNGRLTPSSLTITDKNEIILIGNYFFQDWIVNNDTLQIDTSINKYQGVAYIIKYDNIGNLIWIKRFHQNLQPKHLDTDIQGNTIVTGKFDSYVFLEGDTIFTLGAASDQLFTKFDQEGQLLWSKRMGDQSSNDFTRILSNSKSDYFITGELKNPNLGPVLHKFSESGNELWNINAGPGNRMGGEMKFDYTGNLITTGTYTSPLSIGMDTLDYSFPWGEYILKLGDQSAPVVVDKFLGDLLIQYKNATCGMDNGSAKIQSSIGIEFKAISWSTVSTIDSITGLEAGEYSVTVTDRNGNTNSKSINIDSIPVDSLVITAVNTTCGNNDGMAQVTTSGNIPIISFVWSTGDTLSQIENLAGGTYFVTTTDINGCQANGKIDIIGLLNPVVNLGEDINIYQGEQAELDAGGNNLIYLWSTGETTQNIIVNNPGLYSVTVTNSDHCSASDSVMVTVLVLTINIGPDKNFSVWPNPTTNLLHILADNDLDYQVNLFDLTGKLRYSDEGISQIDMSSFPNAIYLLEFIDKSLGYRFIKKIVVNR